jgi:hypothetical protein
MKSHEIEGWAWRVIEQVKNGRPSEDFRVELKGDWPASAQKAARRIAGHANAARGEPILWVIGVDEDEGVRGVTNFEVSDWYNQVKAQFDGGVAPQLTSLNINVEGRVVVALLLSTDRPPYVVKNASYGTPGGGSVTLEVPWREGNSTRTAGRAELLNILTPMQVLPAYEIRSGLLLARPSSERNVWKWTLILEIYMTPKDGARTALPFHQCEASFELPGQVQLTPLAGVHLAARKSEDSPARATATELFLDGPGMVFLRASLKLEAVAGDLAEEAQVHAKILPANAAQAIVLNETLRYVPDDKLGVMYWTFGNPPGLKDMKKRASLAAGVAAANAGLRRRSKWEI